MGRVVSKVQMWYCRDTVTTSKRDEDEMKMKKLFTKVAIAVLSCAFFTVIVPILLTSAQNSLFAAGFGLMFVFFAICLYLLMTSKFFKTKDELAAETEKTTLEPAV